MKNFYLAIGAVILLSTVATGNGGPFSDQTRIVILLAMDEDFKKVTDQGKNVRQTSVGGINVSLLEIDGKKIALSKVGRGPAKAAVSALASILGGDDPWYLFTVTPAAGLCGQPVGDILVPQKLTEQGGGDILKIDTKSVLGDKWEGEIVQLCSVDSFISSNEEAQNIASNGNCLLDMNSYWISEVAEKAGASHIPIRVVSDDAGSGAGEQFKEFAKNYKGEGAEFLLQIIRDLPVPLNSAMAHENILSEINADGVKKSVDR